MRIRNENDGKADDLKIYIYKGLRSEFKDIITTLSARPEAVSFVELHSLLLSHEFIHEKTINSSTIPEAHMSTRFRPTSEYQHSQPQPQNFGTGAQYGASQTQSYGTPFTRPPYYGNNNYNFNIRGNRGGRNRGRGRNRYSTSNTNTRCQICNGFNHTALNCSQRGVLSSTPMAHYTNVRPNSTSSIPVQKLLHQLHLIPVHLHNLTSQNLHHLILYQPQPLLTLPHL
ncbi:hypothetical protein POM88_010747 [Heracleum sosnowskyi]|uniref:Uncharacterized protein n=1 Tax=Heracleum sosnowskyi TaxID=360622 RepID=A0AAD8IVP9_9APIA|nr:hypothetical protein POM88_010747 [Heracleum sosnowskyi]